MQNMERYGRNGDTMMGHLTPGETVVPQQVLQQNPQIARGLGRAFQDAGADPSRYVVGSGQNSVNPMTGEPEFFLSTLVNIGSKLIGNPMLQGALGNAALRKIQGKDVRFKNLAQGALAGGGLGALMGKSTGIGSLDSLLGLDTEALSSAASGGTQPSALKSIAGVPDQVSNTADALSDAVSRSVPNKLDGGDFKRAEGLLGIGEAFNTKEDTIIGRLLNTKFGEGLASGGIAQLLDSLFSKDEDLDPNGTMARFNRGAGQAPINFAEREIRDRDDDYLLMANEGGPAYFPRRNGGIMPSEGSGTKDDVPAMLTAGEFVMTRDAVKGAGGGDLNSGINKMYGMMDSLERKV
jgi:hypothetical protein